MKKRSAKNWRIFFRESSQRWVFLRAHLADLAVRRQKWWSLCSDSRRAQEWRPHCRTCSSNWAPTKQSTQSRWNAICSPPLRVDVRDISGQCRSSDWTEWPHRNRTSSRHRVDSRPSRWFPRDRTTTGHTWDPREAPPACGLLCVSGPVWRWRAIGRRVRKKSCHLWSLTEICSRIPFFCLIKYILLNGPSLKCGNFFVSKF